MANDMYLLTTEDNPYNPFTQYNEWYAFDVIHGYNTCGYLARIAHTSDELSEEDEHVVIQNAIDEIVLLNITGNYKKVREEDYQKG
jgi:hypothetical protein